MAQTEKETDATNKPLAAGLDRARLIEAMRDIHRKTNTRLRDRRFALHYLMTSPELIDAILALAAPAEGYVLVPVAWNRCDSANQVMLYTLRQDGWRKGQPLMVNDVTVTVQKANASETDIEPVVATILSALTQPAPDGWVLVPVEPDEVMIEQGRVVGSLRFANRASDIYRAMISASPAPPAQGAGG